MGADWLRRTQDKYKHALKEGTRKGLRAKSLFLPKEQETVSYACQRLDDSKTPPVDTRLTIFQSDDKARVAVMHGNRAVAEVRGEGARDLKKLFREHPECRNTLAVKIVRIDGSSESFYVQPLISKKKD